MPRIKLPAFIPLQEEGGWRVYWAFPDGSKRPMDGGTLYTRRQAAYRRAKLLNDTNNAPDTIYCRITVDREDCPPILKKLREMAPPYDLYILDPLDRHRPNRRYLQFELLCRYKGEYLGMVFYTRSPRGGRLRGMLAEPCRHPGLLDATTVRRRCSPAHGWLSSSSLKGRYET